MTEHGIYQTHLTARQNLNRLSIIRGVALLGQLLALVFFTSINPIGLPTEAIALVLAIYASVTVAGWLRSRLSIPITQREFFIHLLADIFFFSMLMYFSGGASNPFISYFLIPISIAAITLPRHYSILIGLAALLSYSLLLNYFVAIDAIAPSGHGHHQASSNNLHILGMWANFAISTLIITYFISRMANALKRQQQQIAEQREAQLRDEQLLAVGTLAAGTAHELGTPLNTMKLLVDEMTAEAKHPEADLQLLNQQLELCKTTLKQLLMTAEQSQHHQQQTQLLQAYFSGLLQRWLLMRPRVNANITLADREQSASFHPTVDQSIINLLNNAADASPHNMDINVDWDNDQARISIRDYGAGLDADKVDDLGQAFVTDKADGLGLGLFLSRATLTRFGGTVSLQNAPEGGTITEIILPLNDKSAPGNAQ
jgi:two-component system sensor histidine kinase RegB